MRIRIILNIILLSSFLVSFKISQSQEQKIEKWEIFEISYSLKNAKKPFTKIILEAVFSKANKEYKVKGFYDGNDTFRIRFLPSELGN